MSQKTRWAILLCRYSDDNNDPNVTTMAQLAAQNPGAPWVVPPWLNNPNTLLEQYQLFFTAAGAATNNMTNYFTVMSHGSVSLGAEIFPCQLDRTAAEAAKLAASESGEAYQENTFKAAKRAWTTQWRVDPDQFYAVVVSFQSPDLGSQGGTYDGGPGVFMDIRYVMQEGPMRWAHEMGHAFGLDHSRADSPNPNFNPTGCTSGPPDYRDPWDTMSAKCTFWTPDINFTSAGPGLNAWNMRSRGWLDETRVWHCPEDIFSQVLTLRPLHRIDLDGLLAAEIPPLRATGVFPRYLVEFRLEDAWDLGIPRSCVQVHRYDGNVGQFLNTHSYIQFSESGSADMIVGDIFFVGSTDANPSPQVRVLAVDEAGQSAQVHISYLPQFLGIAAASNEDGRIEVFCIAQDQSIHHFWQVTANAGWTSTFPKIGPNDLAKYITMTQTPAQTLEVFYVGMDNHLYHNWQTAKNGNWHGEARISDHSYAKQIAVGTNLDGRIQIFYRGTNDRLYYNVKKTNGNWEGEKELGNGVEKVAVGTNQDNRLEVVLIGLDGTLSRRKQQQVSQPDKWGALTLLHAAAKDFALTKCSDQQLELLFIDNGNQLFHIFQNTPTGDWSMPERLQPFANKLAVATNSNGLLEMFFTDVNDVLIHCKQPRLHIWDRATTAFDGAAKELLLIPNKDGHLELIYIGTDDALYHNWQLGFSSNWNGELPF